jgi:hypothetical protein
MPLSLPFVNRVIIVVQTKNVWYTKKHWQRRAMKKPVAVTAAGVDEE